MPFPWIHSIDIVNLVMTLKFNMPRNLNLPKRSQVDLFSIKFGRTIRRFFTPCKFPCSIQRLTQSLLSCFHIFCTFIKMMIRMCIQTVYPKYLGILQPRQLWLHNLSSCKFFPLLFCLFPQRSPSRKIPQGARFFVIYFSIGSIAFANFSFSASASARSLPSVV